MYDINNDKFDKKVPNEEDLLNEVTDIEIFRYYIGEFEVGIPFSSPLEKDDNPSFGIYPSKKYLGRLLYKDHRGNTGGSITFVRSLYNLDYKSALNRIIVDFELDNKFHVLDTSIKQTKPVEFRLNVSERKEIKSSNPDLRIKSREWQPYDENYWKQQGISRKGLDLFDIIPIKFYWIYGKMYRADKFAYAYKERKDGVLNYKIYQPYRDSNKHKFVNGFLDGTFSGWELLPNKTDLIIITKSTKDVVFLYEHGYYAVSPQGEGYNFKPQVIDILKTKADRIVTLYDHDNAGIKAAKRNREEFGFEFVTTCNFNYKDITDFYRKFGKTETLELLNLILK